MGDGAEGAVPEGMRDDIGAHEFRKQGTTALFDTEIISLDAGSYLRMLSERVIVKTERDNMDN